MCDINTISNAYNVNSKFLTSYYNVCCYTATICLSMLQLLDINIMYNPKPKSIKLTSEEVGHLLVYLYECDMKGFVGINNYTRHNPVREYLYRWHLKAFAFRVHTSYKSTKPLYRLRISEPELMTVCAMFHRVDCTAPMLELQTKFKNL